MPTITFDVGGTNLVLPCERAGKALPRRVGDVSDGYSGGERSHIRREYQVIPLVLVNATPADCATLETMFALGVAVDCAGDVFNNAGATVPCSGDYTDDMLPYGDWRVPGITLYEARQ